MTKRMLIDATHSEETRVAMIDDGRLEEFDYESAFRKPLKGNIFLAKVTRVEPSLQAAFVNFGGNRHGFLPFSEIHPDYFRIPIADREALIAEQEAMLAEHDARARREMEEEEAAADGPDDASEGESEDSVEVLDDAADAEDDADDVDGNSADDSENAEGEETSDDADEDGRRRGRGGKGRGRGRGRGRGGRSGHRSRRTEAYEDEDSEAKFRFNLRRKYKIQEVIKRGQIMLIQVSKEERGNKGAAVTSYLSLPGRYCVLMPNSPRGGGVSRKVSSYKERATMRELLGELDVPKGMSTIIRTAGVSRTKAEVKRDFDYLSRTWSEIREQTLKSSAPALIYEEANLIKRSVRDLYTRDVEELIVAGEEGYQSAKGFMKVMIPSHVRRVKLYDDKEMSLFNRYKIEGKIAEIGETEVTLPSGGYLVINPTEALVSVDVNSGRSTKERHIEETALKTNLEAAEEVARQLRLRDLGGLVVIDFIDMENRRNNGKVERKMREALSTDRARVQMGRISNFGLMELSRQRLNPSLGESQFEVCSNCEGRGRTRTADALSIQVLREIEEEGAKARAAQVIVHVRAEVALYILNNKRDEISALEARYGFAILIRVDDDQSASSFRIEVSKPADKPDDDDGETGSSDRPDDRDERGGRGRRRGRRGGRGRGRERDQDSADDKSADDSGESSDKVAKESEGVAEDKPKRGRKPAAKKAEKEAASEDKPKKKPATKKKASKDASDEVAAPEKEDKPKKKPAAKKKAAPKKKKDEPAAEVDASNDDAPAAKSEPPAAKEYETVNEPPKKKKSGWWSKG